MAVFACSIDLYAPVLTLFLPFLQTVRHCIDLTSESPSRVELEDCFVANSGIASRGEQCT